MLPEWPSPVYFVYILYIDLVIWYGEIIESISNYGWESVGIMSWEVSVEEICRACMQADGVLLPMFDGRLGNKNLPNKLAELASIKIDQSDGLPTKLCAKCAYRTDAFYDFKMQVRATEIKLRKILQIQKSASAVKQAEYHAIENKLIERAERCDEVSISSDDEILRIITVQSPGGRYSKKIERINHRNVDPVQSQLRVILDQNTDLYQIGADTLVQDFEKNATDHVDDETKADNSDYAIVYLPDVAQTSSLRANDTYADTDPESPEEYKVHWPLEENSSDEHGVLIHETKSEPLAYYAGRVVSGEDLETDNESCSVQENDVVHGMESDSEDSDYFADPKDNVLGSLNDTVVKIREIRTGDEVTSYQCTLCMENYEQLTRALNHIVDNHVPASGPFFCTVCEKDCNSRRDLRSHIKVHTGLLPYVCFICNRAYSVKRYLKRHMVSHPEFYRHRCPKCGDRFKMKIELATHVTSHIRGSPYACSQCPRVFNHKGNYKRHLITHLDPQGLHLPKYPCNICGKRFLNNRTLETHTRVHTGEKPFKCNTCNKAFSQQGNLLNHQRIHSNPRSYTCEVCGKQFNQRSTLKDHSLLHTGEKPYVCTACGIAFTFSAALRRHMWTHSGGKPYGCEICDARFVGKYDLKRHMSIHSDRPRSRKRRNQNKEEDVNFVTPKDDVTEGDADADNTETILIENVLLNEDETQIVIQEESEKENVDALFTLIQYGE